MSREKIVKEFKAEAREADLLNEDRYYTYNISKCVSSNVKLKGKDWFEDTEVKGWVVKELVIKQYPDRGGRWSKTYQFPFNVGYIIADTWKKNNNSVGLVIINLFQYPLISKFNCL